MAYVRVKYESAQGDQISVTLDIESSYPDAISESVSQAAAMMREASALFFITTAPPNQADDLPDLD